MNFNQTWIFFFFWGGGGHQIVQKPVYIVTCESGYGILLSCLFVASIEGGCQKIGVIQTKNLYIVFPKPLFTY